MTFIITATVTAAAVYFAIALVACLHDCLVIRYRRQIAPALDLDFAALSEELGGWDELLDIVPAPTAPAVDTRDFKSPLPTKIRELREFVRAENLQDSIKQLTGKSVSSLKKDELMEAVRMAIA
jgi:hypothetical protein